MRVLEILEKINDAKKDLEFLPTGIATIDQGLDGGFIKSELIVLGAFTGIGKSYLAAQIMYNIAKKGFNTGYFSLEITNEMIISRLIGQLANVKSIKVVTGNMHEFEYNKKLVAEGKIIGYEKFMDFHDDIYEYSKIEQTIRDSNYEFIVIDFIQNIFVKGMNEYERLSFIALSLQKLAKEKKCCILLLSQLSNMAARSRDDSPLEYKGSGSIATVCDLGFILVRDFDLGIMTLGLRKNRRGASGISWQLSFGGEGGQII